MKDDYILAIDQGTTGTAIVLINQKGQIAFRSYRELTQYYPSPGWVEHDPEEIWRGVLSTVDLMLRVNNIAKDQIKAIGIANQRETAIVWDRRTGRPIHNAIVWQCRRTADICEKMRNSGLSEIIKQKTGLLIDPYFSATKLMWILDNIEGARESAEKGNLIFGNVDTWLLWKLTGGTVHATDYTNASRTMFFNINTLNWDDDLLSEMKIPKSMLPEVLQSSAHFGEISFGNNLLDGIPITGVAGDQQAALFGQACFNSGDVKNTYGTGCFIMLNTGDKPILSNFGLLTTLACSDNDQPVYALEGSIFNTGSAIQWLRDGLKIIKTADETESLATSVPDTDGVYLVPAFTGLGAPYWDADVKGIITGITRGTKHEHIVRAALESIAYQTFDVLKVMQKDYGKEIKRLRVDGGSGYSNFLMQFQSDILNIEIDRSEISDSTALGSAFLAGLSIGFWSNKDEIEECRIINRIFKPNMTSQQRDKLLKGWYDAIDKARYKRS